MKKFISTTLSLVMVLGTLCVPVMAESVELPDAIATEIDVSEISDVELTFAMNFVADEITDEQLDYYGDWYADFVLTLNKDVTFNADGTQDGYIAGQYDAYSTDWVVLPGEDVTIEADEPFRIMAYAAEEDSNFEVTCNDVYTFVNEFNCGVYFTDEFVSENPDIQATLELVIYNPEDDNESYLIGESNDFVVELPTATATEIDVDDLTFAMNFLADDISDAQLAAYGDWYADFVLTLNKDVTFNADGSQDGYLAGQYDAYSADWISLPLEDVTIEANEPFGIMAYAAEGDSQFEVTCNDVYTFVQDFDCGVYFDEEFLSENRDLVATLELVIYNPETEESQVIGETYEFDVALPTATATELDVDDIEDVELTFAMNFLADEITDRQLELYGGWNADFVLTLNKDVTFNADGSKDGYLAGQYDAYSPEWVVLPPEDVTIEADVPFQIMTSAYQGDDYDFEVTCYDVYTFVNEFNCGVYFSDEFIEDNRDIEATLELVIYNPETEESQVIGEAYEFTLPAPKPPVTSLGGNTPAKYVVSFETNGGSEVKDQKILINETVSEPEAPTKEGYTFDGWYLDEGFLLAYDFETKVTKGFVLYAKWIENEEEKNEEEIPGESTMSFTDVSETEWYYDDVKFVVESGLMNGMGEETFEPESLLTRGMLVTILYRNEGEPPVNRSIPFQDIDLPSYYRDAVIWAHQNGIVNGITENEFAPNQNITREQIIAIMYRYAEFKGYDLSVGENTNILSYDDVDSISEYAIPAVQYTVGSGVIKGRSDTTINPKDYATRAELAAILSRFIKVNN